MVKKNKSREYRIFWEGR